MTERMLQPADELRQMIETLNRALGAQLMHVTALGEALEAQGGSLATHIESSAVIGQGLNMVTSNLAKLTAIVTDLEARVTALEGDQD